MTMYESYTRTGLKWWPETGLNHPPLEDVDMESIAFGLLAFGFAALIIGVARMISPKDYAFAVCAAVLLAIGALMGFGFGDSE